MRPAQSKPGQGDGADRREIRTQVARACRILADEGYSDLTLGHVSARDPEHGDRMWIKRRGVSLAEVEPEDVIAFGIEEDPGSAPDEMHLEAILHMAVYKNRTDVGAVVHGHPRFATAFGATDAELLYLTHDAVMFEGGIPTFDETPGLITKAEQGAAVADKLGQSIAVLLRNHGVLVAHKNVPWVVLAAATLERAVMLQSLCAGFGTPRPMSDADARELYDHKYNDGLVDEYWHTWVRDMRRRGLDIDRKAGDE